MRSGLPSSLSMKSWSVMVGKGRSIRGIFVIRTRGNPFRSRPSTILTATSLAVVAVATALPFTPLGARIGFVPLPGLFFGILAGMVLTYLAMVQVVKMWFYRHFAPE